MLYRHLEVHYEITTTKGHNEKLTAEAQAGYAQTG